MRPPPIGLDGDLFGDIGEVRHRNCSAVDSDRVLHRIWREAGVHQMQAGAGLESICRGRLDEVPPARNLAGTVSTRDELIQPPEVHTFADRPLGG